jgi:hypothetical protein
MDCLTDTPFYMGKHEKIKLSLLILTTRSGRGGKDPGIFNIGRRHIQLQKPAWLGGWVDTRTVEERAAGRNKLENTRIS